MTRDLNHLEQEQFRRIMSNWKLTPATFARKISRGTWIPSPHLQYISLRIAKSLAKGNARIILSMPPRHGKSELLSVYTPAWILEYLKDVNIILASYGADLAEGFSRRVRGILRDPNNADLLKARIGDLSQAEQFNTILGGYMYAVGLGGAITGRGAHVLMIDDYIKEIKEALSPAYRDYIWNWYVTTALTRLEPNGSIIITATRWHSDDLIGRLLEHERDEWEYIELPALAVQNDIIGREIGDPLFPERYTAETLHKRKNTLGTIFFEALYQQHPVDETQSLTDVNWLRIWGDSYGLPDKMAYCRVWDLAATANGGDFLTGTLCAYEQKTERFFIMDVQRAQLGPGKVEAFVKEIAEQDGYGVKIGIEKEPGSASMILIEHYKNNVLPDYRVEAIPVSKAKVVRAQPFLAACEAGSVFLLHNPRWNKAFKDEFETFPNSTNKAIHDDQIDTAAGGYTMLTGKSPLSATWGKSTLASSKEQQGPRSTQKSGPGSKKTSVIEQAHASFSIKGADRKGATWGSR